MLKFALLANCRSDQKCMDYSFGRQKDTRITNAFQKVLDKLYCKPNKARVEKGGAFYIRSIKLLLEMVCIQ